VLNRQGNGSVEGTAAFRYFLNRFGANSFDSAVERAADEVRNSLQRCFEGTAVVPVDVWSLARGCGIEFGPELPATSRDQAELMPKPNGFIVRTRSGVGEPRLRFTIAHEIGHTLFFDGVRHRIGIQSKQEFRAEETICERFASALLMPAEQATRSAMSISGDSAWDLLSRFDALGKWFNVSLPAVAMRFAVLRPAGAGILIVLTRYTEHGMSGRDAKLRHWVSCQLGFREKYRIWRDRTAQGINLLGALKLFDAWRQLFFMEGRDEGGRFVLAGDGTVCRADKETTEWSSESVELGCYDVGSWRNVMVPMLGAHWLYAPPKAELKNCYIVSILRNVT